MKERPNEQNKETKKDGHKKELEKQIQKHFKTNKDRTQYKESYETKEIHT